MGLEYEGFPAPKPSPRPPVRWPYLLPEIFTGLELHFNPQDFAAVDSGQTYQLLFMMTLSARSASVASTRQGGRW